MTAKREPFVVGIDDLADRFGVAIEALDRRRVHLEDLWRCLLTAEPSFVTAADKRLRLASALEALAGVGRIELPGPRSYDSGAPRLPRFVLVAAAARRTTAAPLARRFPWRPELDWAADLRLGAGPLEMLKSINAFLRDGGNRRPDVPAQERSLMLFGDEKALGALAGTALFGPGRLSWELLRCHPVHPPFVWRRVGAGSLLLVVENQATFDSLARALPDDGPVGTLAYGAGNHFIASVASAVDLPGLLDGICYFGDVDAQGLAIPVRAGGVAAAVGLPPIEPAEILYELLFANGRPAAHDGGPVEAQAAQRRAAWLPDRLRPDAIQLLEQGRRLAQEWVGLELLQRDLAWSQRLTSSAKPIP